MFIPVNRYIAVELPAPKEDRSSDILLPEDYNPIQAKHVVGTVIEYSDDVRYTLHIGDKVIIDRSMIEEIEVENESYFIVLDNYIVGRYTNS